MAEDIVELLSRPGSPIILLFDPQRRYLIPRRYSIRKYTVTYVEDRVMAHSRSSEPTPIDPLPINVT